jgi:hypothetical protein
VIVTLTQAERDRFAAWLEQDAASNMEMAKMMLADGQPPHMRMMGEKLKSEAAAFLLVARKLRSIEDMTIGSEEVTP